MSRILKEITGAYRYAKAIKEAEKKSADALGYWWYATPRPDWKVRVWD